MPDSSTIKTVVIGLLCLLIAINLSPAVQSGVTGVTGTGGNNFTGGALTLMQQVPLFWVIVILGVAIAIVLKVL